MGPFFRQRAARALIQHKHRFAFTPAPWRGITIIEACESCVTRNNTAGRF